MSNQIKGLVVTFKTPIHEDKAGRIKAAIECLSDVAAVSTSIDEWDDQMNRMQVKMEISAKLWEALK